MEKVTETYSSGAVTIQGTKSKGRRREQGLVESHHPTKVNSEETKPRNKPPHLISFWSQSVLSFCLIQTKARLHGDLLMWSTQAQLLEDSTGGRKAIWPSPWPLLLSIHARLPSCLVIKPEEQSSLYSRLKLFQVSFLLWDPLKTIALRAPHKKTELACPSAIYCSWNPTVYPITLPLSFTMGHWSATSHLSL